MGFHKGGGVQNFTPTLHQVLTDMQKFREKAENDPGYTERIQISLNRLKSEGNRVIAQQLENLTELSDHPVDTQPWSLGDNQLKEHLARAVNFLGDGELIGEAGNAALDLMEFETVKISAILDLAATLAERQATEAIINIRREMARRGLSEQ